jgi:hypothetical protein
MNTANPCLDKFPFLDKIGLYRTGLSLLAPPHSLSLHQRASAIGSPFLHYMSLCPSSFAVTACKCSVTVHYDPIMAAKRARDEAGDPQLPPLPAALLALPNDAPRTRAHGRPHVYPMVHTHPYAHTRTHTHTHTRTHTSAHTHTHTHTHPYTHTHTHTHTHTRTRSLASHRQAAVARL